MAKVETTKFIRKSFPVDAVQVTPENMADVAQWCAGEILEDGEKEGHLSRTYIKVRVAFPINERQTQAYLGDWVLKSGKSFKVYTNPAFEKSFDAMAPSSAPQAKRPVPTKPKNRPIKQVQEPSVAEKGEATGVTVVSVDEPEPANAG